jgi:hypothetical protein
MKTEPSLPPALTPQDWWPLALDQHGTLGDTFNILSAHFNALASAGLIIRP